MLEIEEKAIQKFYEFNDGLYEEFGGLMVRPGATIYEEDLLMFFYNTTQYVLTGDFSYMIVGHGGVIVDKATLDLYETGSAYAPEYYINWFRKDRAAFDKMKPLSF